MTIVATREQRRQLARDNARLPPYLVPLPEESWPDFSGMTKRPTAVWRSRSFLVQVFDEHHLEGRQVWRLTVARAELGKDGRWIDGISWEELQQIKRQIGLGSFYAIEVFPRDRDVVNVANMRHLWVLDKPLDIGWFK